MAYLIIGNGRLARHLQHYLQLCRQQVNLWQRSLDPDAQTLPELVAAATHVIVCIHDSEIESFLQKHTKLWTEKRLIHCSGSLYSDMAVGAHPLMTFSADQLYPLQVYQQIPFILDHKNVKFEECFPGLTNPHYYLEPRLKARYHAMCVLSGNFTAMLWQKFFSELSDNFGLPENAGLLYCQQQFQNILAKPQAAQTGPLVRDDDFTILQNLQALSGDPFQAVYRAFVQAYRSHPGIKTHD